jgi:hypothetical protein
VELLELGRRLAAVIADAVDEALLVAWAWTLKSFSRHPVYFVRRTTNGIY